MWAVAALAALAEEALAEEVSVVAVAAVAALASRLNLPASQETLEARCVSLEVGHRGA